MNVQNKFKKTNTIYKITKDMNLEGSTLIIPVGCTLDFQGGSFKNGTIEGNGTAIQSELRRIFDDNIVLEGMWNVKEAYPEWFGGKGDGVTDNTQAINNCIKYFTNTYISAGTYITNQIDDIPSFRTINGCGKKSIIQANPKMNLTNSYLLRTKNGGSGITFSNFVLLGGANSTESNYKIGGIYLRSTSNDVNDQWDTRNIIQNVEIKYCYAASIYVGTYQRENKISNCFITHTTNVGINCMGTDNMIIGCTVASSHHEGIVINGNNRVDSCKCFGCGASSTVTGKYALSLIGSKCNVSNVELQQNNYGGCIIQGNSNYVQITCDNNGSGTTNTVLGCHVVGSYNTVSVTSYNFSFHDNQYERYFVSTNWNTVGNNITVNGTPLQKNKMSALSPWSVDNICNNIMWNGYNITQSREVPFDKLVLPDLFRSNGTGSFYVNDSGLSFKLTSVTAVNVDALVQAISIHNSNAIDPDGCFSVKARFHKDGDIDTSVYPIIRVITRYKDSSGTTLTRVDQNTTVNLLDNKDSLDVYALTQYHYLSDKPASILSVSVEFAIRSTKLLSDVSINAYFDDIKIGATTSGNKVKFVNTNIDGTLASKVIIANKLSDFTQENTIYKITTDLNLNTAILELPANCTLDFQGGSISNGTIVGSNTKIRSGLNIIFDNITIGGTWDNDKCYLEWFNPIDSKYPINEALKLSKSLQLLKNTYPIVTVSIPDSVCIQGESTTESIISIDSTIDIDNNNIILKTFSINPSDIFVGDSLIKVHSSYYCVFEKLNMGSSKVDTAIIFDGTDSSYYHTITNCNISSFNTGIKFTGHANANNVLYNNFYLVKTNIVIDSCNGLRIIGNTFQDFKVKGIDILYSTGSRPVGNSISSNYFEGDKTVATCDIDFNNTAEAVDNMIIGNHHTYMASDKPHILNMVGPNTIIDSTRSTIRNKSYIAGIPTLEVIEKQYINALGADYLKSSISPIQIDSDNMEWWACIQKGGERSLEKVFTYDNSKDWVQLDKGLIVPFITQYYGQGITLGYDATLSDRKLTFDNQRHLLKYGYDSKWNYVSTLLSGTTANRPSADLNMPVGLQYFDTTISKPIYWTGTGWVDSTGVTV